MKKNKIIEYNIITNLFGLIEIGLGLVTAIALIVSYILGESNKPSSVFIFVLITSFISLSLGVGILRRKLIFYYILLYFSSVIILSKILIFLGLVTLSGALETTISMPLKNIISIFYHSILIFYFIQPAAKKEFCT